MTHAPIIFSPHEHEAVLVLVLRILALVILAMILLGTERAQAAPASTPEIVMPENPPAVLAGMNFDEFTDQQWRELRRKVVRELRSGDEATRVQALQSIIFLSSYYRDRIDFQRTSPRLFDLYTGSPNEQMRIMAVSALDAVGNPEVMAHMRHVWRLERSERVRHAALATLVNYYRAHQVTFGEPEIVR